MLLLVVHGNHPVIEPITVHEMGPPHDAGAVYAATASGAQGLAAMSTGPPGYCTKNCPMTAQI